jgi:hypothetical protein
MVAGASDLCKKWRMYVGQRRARSWNFVLRSASAPSEHLQDYAELIDDAQSRGYPTHMKSVRRAFKVDEADAFGSTYFAPVSDSHQQSFVVIIG